MAGTKVGHNPKGNHGGKGKSKSDNSRDSEILRDDEFKTRHPKLSLVRAAQEEEVTWSRPHTFETLMRAARVLYDASNDDSFDFDFVYGEPESAPTDGVGSIFDSRTPINEEWNEVQRVLLKNPGTKFYVVRQFGFLLIGDGRLSNQYRMANVRSTALREGLEHNCRELRKSIEYLFAEHIDSDFDICFGDKNGIDANATFSLAMTNEDLYRNLLWKLDTMEALVKPEKEEWGPFRTIYDQIPDQVKPRFRQDFTELSNPVSEFSVKGDVDNSVIRIRRLMRQEEQVWEEPRTWESFMAICKDLYQIEEGEELMFDAQAVTVNNTGQTVESKMAVTGLRDSAWQLVGKMEEFDDLKRAAEGGVIELVRHIEHLTLTSIRSNFGPQSLVIGEVFRPVYQDIIKDRLSDAIEKIFPDAGSRRVMLYRSFGKDPLTFRRSMTRREFWEDILSQIEDDVYLLYEAGEVPHWLASKEEGHAGDSDDLTLDDVLKELCRCSFCNEALVPDDLRTDPKSTLYNTFLNHMTLHLDQWLTGPVCEVECCHALLGAGAMSEVQRFDHIAMHTENPINSDSAEVLRLQEENDRLRRAQGKTPPVMNLGPKSVLKIIKFNAPSAEGVAPEPPADIPPAILQASAVEAVEKKYAAKTGKQGAKRKASDAMLGTGTVHKRPSPGVADSHSSLKSCFSPVKQATVDWVGDKQQINTIVNKIYSGEAVTEEEASVEWPEGENDVPKQRPKEYVDSKDLEVAVRETKAYQEMLRRNGHGLVWTLEEYNYRLRKEAQARAQARADLGYHPISKPKKVEFQRPQAAICLYPPMVHDMERLNDRFYRWKGFVFDREGTMWTWNDERASKILPKFSLSYGQPPVLNEMERLMGDRWKWLGRTFDYDGEVVRFEDDEEEAASGYGAGDKSPVLIGAPSLPAWRGSPGILPETQDSGGASFGVVGDSQDSGGVSSVVIKKEPIDPDFQSSDDNWQPLPVDNSGDDDSGVHYGGNTFGVPYSSTDG